MVKSYWCSHCQYGSPRVPSGMIGSIPNVCTHPCNIPSPCDTLDWIQIKFLTKRKGGVVSSNSSFPEKYWKEKMVQENDPTLVCPGHTNRGHYETCRFLSVYMSDAALIPCCTVYMNKAGLVPCCMLKPGWTLLSLHPGGQGQLV